jgi:hypothetical protein
MNKATYIVGDYQYSPLAIEHSILRANSYRPSLSSLLPVHKYKKNDERLASVLEQAEPLISFALACGTRSSPAVGPLAPAFLSSSCAGVVFWLSFLFLPTLLSEIFALVKLSTQHMLCVLLLSLVRIKWTLMGFFLLAGTNLYLYQHQSRVGGSLPGLPGCISGSEQTKTCSYSKNSTLVCT